MRTLAMIRGLVAANPRRMASTLALLLAVGLAEGVGIVTLLPVLGIATGRGSSSESSQLGQTIAGAVHA